MLRKPTNSSARKYTRIVYKVHKKSYISPNSLRSVNWLDILIYRFYFLLKVLKVLKVLIRSISKWTHLNTKQINGK